MSKYATVKEVIKEVQAIREVEKSQGVLSAYAEDEKNLIVDVVPFLESLEKYEVVGEMIELYDYDTDEYTDLATYYITDEQNNEVHSGDDYFGYEYDEIKEKIMEILSEVIE